MDNPYKVYHELIKYVDSQVSKLFFGQDVVSNNTGQVVGEVGENVANMSKNKAKRSGGYTERS